MATIVGERKWWIGAVATCGFCGVRWRIDSDDEIDRQAPENERGVYCPKCNGRNFISIRNNFFGDPVDAAIIIGIIAFGCVFMGAFLITVLFDWLY